MNRPHPLIATLIAAATALACTACSPQRRIGRIVARHPALRADTTIALPVTHTLRPLTAARLITPRTPAGRNDAPPCAADLTTGASVTAGAARATLAVTDSGLVLTAQQLPLTLTDTLHVTRPRIDLSGTHPPDGARRPIDRFLRLAGLAAIATAAANIALRIRNARRR